MNINFMHYTTWENVSKNTKAEKIWLKHNETFEIKLLITKYPQIHLIVEELFMLCRNNRRLLGKWVIFLFQEKIVVNHSDTQTSMFEKTRYNRMKELKLAEKETCLHSDIDV